MHFVLKKKYLYFSNYKLKCSIGKRGIKKNKNEGDRATPRGTYALKSVFYRKDRVKRFKCKIKTISIKKNMGWCDDPRSNRYNKLIKYPFKYKSEKLFRADNIYDIILVLNFNMNPIKKYKGSAIFIHVAKRKFSPTKGCVALEKKELRKLLKTLKKNSKIKIC